VQEALARAELTLEQLDAIAVTCRPGLMGALLVGVQCAKALAFATGKPLVGVDHLVGHLLAVFLRAPGAMPPPDFPFVALLASGGHTSIYRVDGPLGVHIRELGGTRDDAAGEAFDKVSKLLGLGYPGGPVIDRRAAKGNPKSLLVPRPMNARASLEMSFSGIKTFLASWVAREGVPTDSSAIDDVCASFQAAVVDTLVRKTIVAAHREKLQRVVLSGGVAANRGLRSSFAEACERNELKLFVPPISVCTDNAAMIGYAGAQRFLHGEQDSFDLGVSTMTSLARATRRGGGRRS
jgi:N6-L-threonylcarbamoyladenine synthase